MRIVWNKSSWYATCGAILFSITVLPFTAYRISTEYVDTLTTLDIVNQDIDRALFNESVREQRVALLQKKSGLSADMSGVFGVAKITPVCTETNTQHGCIGDPYQGAFLIQAITDEGKYPFTTDMQGNFVVPLPAGEYMLSMSADSIHYFMAPVAVVVKPKQKKLINLTLDKDL